MLGLRSLPPEYAAWNKRWGAPFGFPFGQELLHQTDMPLEIAARLAGPFAFQANNSTREFEYPVGLSPDRPLGAPRHHRCR